MSITSGSEEQMMANGGIGSPCTEEASGGQNVGGSFPLKKGPWTSAEDAILVDYVTKNGEGNWNAVQKHSGLARCGKSCRLRWANHLRPDLKKCAFTQAEEHRIAELHAQMGNKWARMAAELPGRTDNEIKNYWNTRLKRRQRAGLPVYPPEIKQKAISGNQPNENTSAFSSGKPQHPNILPIKSFEIPSVKFDSVTYDYPKCQLPCSDIHASTLLEHGLNSSYGSKSLLTGHASKRPRQYESLFSGSTSNVTSEFTDCSKYQNDSSPHTMQSFGFASIYGHDPTSDHPSYIVVPPDCHAFMNGNPSSSRLLELPSLQTQMGTWGSPSSPLPSLESVDTLIQSPSNEQTQSGSLCPRNSGLLDAVLHESGSKKNWKNDPCPQICSPSIDLWEGIDYSSADHHEPEWEAYGEILSPRGHSAASVFSKYTSISGSSSDEPQSFDTFAGSNVKQESGDLFQVEYSEKYDPPNLNQMFSRPDYMLGSNCFTHQIIDHGNGSLQPGRCTCGTSL